MGGLMGGGHALPFLFALPALTASPLPSDVPCPVCLSWLLRWTAGVLLALPAPHQPSLWGLPGPGGSIKWGLPLPLPLSSSENCCHGRGCRRGRGRRQRFRHLFFSSLSQWLEISSWMQMSWAQLICLPKRISASTCHAPGEDLNKENIFLCSDYYCGQVLRIPITSGPLTIQKKEHQVYRSWQIQRLTWYWASQPNQELWNHGLYSHLNCLEVDFLVLENNIKLWKLQSIVLE